jgi:uncharacterized protein involved in type VI secretion and phage assembly
MAEDAESDWARVLGAGAGPEAGLCIVPEVDDEVLVTFGHGQFSQPYVLGGLWNGKHALPPESSAATSGEVPLSRAWRSRSGHVIAMYDNADDRVEVLTAGGHSVVLDDAGSKITIASSGGLALELDDSSGKITVEGSNEIQVKAGGNLGLESGGNMNLKAAQLTLEGTGRATLKAPNVTVEGSALVEVKGGLIKLN